MRSQTELLARIKDRVLWRSITTNSQSDTEHDDDDDDTDLSFKIISCLCTIYVKH